MRLVTQALNRCSFPALARGASRAVVTLVALVFAVISLTPTEPSPARLARAAQIYSGTTYTYDATIGLSKVHTDECGEMARAHRRQRPLAPEGSVSISGAGVAAETGTARFTVNSAGEATMSLRAGSTSLEVSQHAALRMTERGISIDAAEATMAQQAFPYFRQGAWKTGYYDQDSRIFLGSANGEVTTVIRGASPNYINNLKAATP